MCSGRRRSQLTSPGLARDLRRAVVAVVVLHEAAAIQGWEGSQPTSQLEGRGVGRRPDGCCGSPRRHPAPGRPIWEPWRANAPLRLEFDLSSPDLLSQDPRARSCDGRTTTCVDSGQCAKNKQRAAGVLSAPLQPFSASRLPIGSANALPAQLEALPGLHSSRVALPCRASAHPAQRRQPALPALSDRSRPSALSRPETRLWRDPRAPVRPVEAALPRAAASGRDSLPSLPRQQTTRLARRRIVGAVAPAMTLIHRPAPSGSVDGGTRRRGGGEKEPLEPKVEGGLSDGL